MANSLQWMPSLTSVGTVEYTGLKTVINDIVIRQFCYGPDKAKNNRQKKKHLNGDPKMADCQGRPELLRYR